MTVAVSGPGLLVSVVVPTHDRCELLGRLLASLEAQSIGAAAYEVIIVHNHTTDGTEQMARAWCARQPFAASYHRKGYNGPARSREFGARQARGRFIAFIDDDCVATPGWLASGVAEFADDARPADAPAAARGVVGAVQGRTLPMPGQQRRFPVKTIRIEAPSVYYETCNMFYRKQTFESVGGFSDDFLDEFYGEDTDLGWKVRQSGHEIRFATDALVHHEVFEVSFHKWLTEPLYFRNLPYLARKYPALRQSMFHRYFLTADTCLFNLFLVAIVVAAFNAPAGALLALPYLVERYRNGAHVGGFRMRLVRVAAGIPRNLLMWWALAGGSLRARTLLI